MNRMRRCHSAVLVIVTMMVASLLEYSAANDNLKFIGRKCATRTPNDEEKDETEQIVRKWMVRHHRRLKKQKEPPNTIPTYFHVISKDGSLEGGNIPTSQIKKQLKHINKSFAPHFKFRLSTITRHANPSWYTAGPLTPSEHDMMSHLRSTGGCHELNVYVNRNDQHNLGWATFPDGCSDPNLFVYDGVVIQTDTLPGGALKDLDEGDTLVHEIGHWLGLYHTFDGGCGKRNDKVKDTPRERGPSFGCPTMGEVDTCPGKKGFDSVDNFMNYVDDKCMTRFTRGQKLRMRAMYDRFRRDDADKATEEEQAKSSVLYSLMPSTSQPTPTYNNTTR